jgi:Fe-S-cluster containining protein
MQGSDSMNIPDLLDEYRYLSEKADKAFERMVREYRLLVKCRIRCSDCCHAVFGVFLIEAAALRERFEKLPRETRREALRRANKADKDLYRVQKRLEVYDKDLHVKGYALAKEKVRCPMLDEDEECILYSHRPITCRVYGIPTAIHGKAHVCPKSDFERGEAYPTFDLDAAYDELYRLSKEMLIRGKAEDPDKASLLISLSKTIKTPLQKIAKGVLE